MSSITGTVSAKRWAQMEPVPALELIEAARERMKSSAGQIQSVIADEIAQVTQTVYTSGVDTLAVTLLPDGFTAQLVNPEFACRLKEDWDLAFVRTHEMYHLLFKHLWGDREATAGDQDYLTAQEATINERVQRVMGDANRSPKDRRMPQALNQEKGTYEDAGVNPYTIWDRYRTDLKEQGLDPVDYTTFYSSDIRCYSELKKMKKNPLPRGKSNHCTTGETMSGNSGGNSQGNQGRSDSNGPGKVQAPHIDKEILKDVVRDGLQGTVKKAVEGERNGVRDNKAKDQISDLMDMPDQDDSISTMWGDIGANALRGETSLTRHVEFWKQYLQEALHSRLAPGERMVYNRMQWWEPRLGRKGDEEYRKVVIAVDTSGSMQQSVLNYIADLVGEEDELEIVWCCFDTRVRPFEIGEPMTGGGGTDIRDLVNWLDEEHNGDYDSVVVVTDGYFAPTFPEDIDKWIALITPGGNGQWMEDGGMTVFDIDLEDMANAA